KGALLAKGRLLGIQFVELMKDDLYLQLANHANRQAMKLKHAFQEKEIPLLADTFTNQIFPILRNEQITKLSQNFDFYIWKKIDEEHSAIRLITSWATDDDVVQKFINEIRDL
ncbi:MAG: threonine aldolase, partial [Cruoricaptor ignavus]|nr:threonine aldolase [Cruoricaptor ignavus]